MAQKKYVSLSKLSTFLDNLKSTFSTLSHKHTISDITDYQVDTELSSTSTNPVQNKVIDAEFDAMSDAMGALELAIDSKANSSHSHDDRYYTEAEVDTLLEGKSDSNHNHDSVYDTKGSADDALASAKEYTNTKTSGLASTATVENAISTHSTSTSAHNDIRVLIADLTEKLNAFLDVDDATTDQLSEVLTLINNNKGTLESLTTNKINVSDIVNNLTTNSTSKVLSAAQGVMIKGLIDALDAEIDTKANTSHIHTIADITNLQSTLDGKAASSHTHTVSQISDLTATATEINYMDGVTSNVQTQLDGKASSSHSHTITASASDDDVVILTGTNGTNKVTYSASHANSGVTAGTYKSVTVNAKGHVTGGSNPTTLAGYGITDAATKTALDSLTTTVNGKANASHTHAISDVTNLQSSLDAKVPATRTINGKALSANITLSASDVDADESGSASMALSNANTYTDNAVAQKTQVQIITWGADD